MSIVVESNPYTASVPDASHYLVARASVEKRSIQQPKVTGKDDESYTRMADKVSYLWAGSEGTAYDEVESAILKRWTESRPSDREFLEKAVDLFVESQKWPMNSMKDTLEWLEYMKKFGIDSKRYFAWVHEQYELLARERRKGFDDITLERFSKSLVTADWKDANDDSARVNIYLLNTEASLKPEIYLGPLGKSRLAVRVNSECLRIQKADFHTAESHGVTAINPDILLDMRYVPLELGRSKQTLLFVPIGESIGPLPLTTSRSMLSKWARECLPYASLAPRPRHYKFRGRGLAGHWNCPSAQDSEKGDAEQIVHG